MTIYQLIGNFGPKFLPKSTLFKLAFNLSPMYRRSCARIIEVSEDIMRVKIKLPISFRNKNYIGSIFGGSMFSATDPICMVQLINILGKEYVVWDKSAEIKFKKPAFKDLFAEFDFKEAEINLIKEKVKEKKEIEIIKNINLNNANNSIIFAEVEKKSILHQKIITKI